MYRKYSAALYLLYIQPPFKLYFADICFHNLLQTITCEIVLVCDFPIKHFLLLSVLKFVVLLIVLGEIWIHFQDSLIRKCKKYDINILLHYFLTLTFDHLSVSLLISVSILKIPRSIIKNLYRNPCRCLFVLWN